MLPYFGGIIKELIFEIKSVISKGFDKKLSAPASKHIFSMSGSAVIINIGI